MLYETTLTPRNKNIDRVLSASYNNSTRQATMCFNKSVEVRDCAGRHCLMELSGRVVQ